jgi:hypothetical protein
MKASCVTTNPARIVVLVVLAALAALAALAVQDHASALLAADVITAKIVSASEVQEMEDMSVAQASSEANGLQTILCTSSLDCTTTQPRCITLLVGVSGCFPVQLVGFICNVDSDCENGLTCKFFDATSCVLDDVTGKCCQSPGIKPERGTSSSTVPPLIGGSSPEAASGRTRSKGDDGGSNLGPILGAVVGSVAGLKKSQNASPPPFIPPAPPAATASLAAQYQTGDTALSDPSNDASDAYAVSGVSSAPTSPAAPTISPQTSAPPMATPWVPSNPDPSRTGQQSAVHAHGNSSSPFTPGSSHQQQPEVYPDVHNASSFVDQQHDQQQTVPSSPYDYGMLSQAPSVPPYMT